MSTVAAGPTVVPHATPLREAERNPRSSIGSPGLRLVLLCAAITALVLLPHTHEYPALVLAPVTYCAALMLQPGLRWRLRSPGPLVLASVFFFVQLVVIPVIIGVAGPNRLVLRMSPSDLSMNLAFALRSFALAALTVGVSVAKRLPEHGGAPTRTRRVIGAPSPIWILALVGAGICGFLLTGFRTVGIRALLTLDLPYVESLADRSHGPGFVLSLLLRVAGVVGLVLLTERRLRLARSVLTRSATLLVVIAGLALIGISFSATRWMAAGLVTALSWTAIWSSGRSVRRGVWIGWFLALAVTVVVAPSWRIARGSSTAGGLETVLTSDTRLWENVLSEVQLYGGSPQMIAVAIDGARQLGKPPSASLLASAMEPVPVLGRPYRAGSGHTYYNGYIYGQGSRIADQPFPAVAEVYLHFWFPGVAVFFIILGLLISRAEVMCRRQRPLGERFAILLTSFWLCSAIWGSITTLSQGLIYFALPVCLMVALRRRAWPRTATT